MEIGAILFSLAMILLVAAYVLQPLSGSSRGGSRDNGRNLSALQAERDRVLDSIQETDMDQAMGKVSEEDYQRQRQALVLEGAEILRSIDELQQNGSADDAALELEAAVAQVRGQSSTPSIELEAAVAELRGKSLTPKTQRESDLGEGACPVCGETILHGDRFCSNCGEALGEQVA